jgi:elongation factor Ts
MTITAVQVKELREKTGAGMMDCKKALEATQGDSGKAVIYLREKGIAKAETKVGRTTSEGVISSYIHAGSKLGTLVEVNCETDFVAKNDEFKNLAREVAMQVAATDPLAVQRSDLSEELVEKEKSIYRTQALSSGKPEKAVEKIIEGKLEKYFATVCLLEQPYVRDPNKTIGVLVKEYIVKFGENITVRRFVRFKLGE